MAKDKQAPWNQPKDEEPAAKGAMVSMERTKAEKKKDKSGLMSSPSPSDGPDYPYGLTFELRDEGLKKLGMEALPEVGEKMCVYAMVEVVRTSQRAGKDSADREVGFQITSLKFVEGDGNGE